MEYRNLGRSGLQVSVFSLGSWLTFGDTVDPDTTEQIMSAAYEAGINYFDGAEAYAGGKAEACMGTVIKRQGWRRDSYILAGKASPNAGSGPGPSQKGMNRKHLIDCCDQTLKRFGVDYLDLYFCHRPDSKTPLEETVRCMNDLISQGKICYWGTSEFAPADLLEMHAIADRLGLIGPTMEQSGYNMLGRKRVEIDLKPLTAGRGMGITAYCPLASGLLTGRYNDGMPAEGRFNDFSWMQGQITEDKINRVRQLSTLASDLDCKVHPLALAWLLKNPVVSTAILGASKPHYIPDNLKALDVLEKLSDEVIMKIADILA